MTGKWFDTGTRENLLEANRYCLAHERNVMTGDVDQNSRIKDGAHISEGAVVCGSVLENGVYVGPYVQVHNAFVSNSVLLDHCRIHDGRVDGCLVGPGAIVGGDLLDTIVSEGAHIVREHSPR